ncbi:uncharacterized protein AC631_00440 [Debaryomyces fabryi]|uniref:Translation machinery-associated protein 16 n=1 Tax=Debaryomyces fabryi TaxID=58627 RepID=A0A0V1Q5S8_9ASCO|nr:uncharacterized protein AC631_00440 [Debaryomyces fabryi]KSA03805.1 hypothetical protein AC631_00440 [Debaryomyces fabryi]CUM45325.1 unnamed protein product [Debaryomyces fabryi]
MPLAHNLNKVTKNLSKSTGQMHVKGRKFKQLNRATLRDQKITAKKLKHQEQKDRELASVQFMKDSVNDHADQEVFLLEQMKAFIEEYIGRHDEELKELKEQRRPGRPATSRQLQLEVVIENEKQVYATGFKIPDLSNKETVERLKLWNGTSGGTTVMKFIHVSKDMNELPVKEEVMKDN